MAIIVIRSEEHSANDPEIRDDRRFEGAGAVDEAIQFLTSLKQGTAPAQAQAPVEQVPPFVETPVVEPEPEAPAGDTSALDAALADEPQTAPVGDTQTQGEGDEDKTGKDEADDVDDPNAPAQPASELEQLLGDQASS